MDFLLSYMLLAVAVVKGATALSIHNQILLGPDTCHFGVGFDLTATYGTAAVSFANGSSIAVASIAADEGYGEVLQRLSLESSQHLVPPYQNPGDAWKDKPREALRSVRKAMGLPASADVGYLAKVLSELRKQVEGHLGRSVDSASVTTLHLIALYQEDLQDAFDYIGLRYLSMPLRYDVLYETSAAYAGYGFGLCSDYTDRVGCKEEQQSMAPEVVLAVLYTRTALTVSFSIMKSAYYLFESDNRHFSNFSLGYDARTQWASSDEYWGALAMNLERMFDENPNYKRPAKVLLLGECAQDEIFKQVLKAALSRQMDDTPEIASGDPRFVAASGAAELAKRVPYDPYKQ